MAAQAWCRGRQPRIRRSSLGWVALVALLSLATLLVFTEMRRYVPVPSPWPFDPQFETLAGGAVPAWEIEGDPAMVRVGKGGLTLRNDEPGATVGVRQLWRLGDGAPHVFRLAAIVASDGVTGTREGFRVGEVTLVAGHDIGRAPFRAIHQLAALSGTQGPARYVAWFEFPSGTREVELAFRLREVTGELTVKGLELKAYRERRLFAAARAGLEVAWALALAAGARLFWRGVDHRRAAVALVAASGTGLFLLLLPEPWRDAILEPLARLTPMGLLGTDALAYVGHFAIFAVAGFLLRLARRREPWPRQLLLLIGLAGLSELLQFMAELRFPTLEDWLTNAVGALAGWLPAALWLRLAQDGQLATQRRSSTTAPPQA